MTFRVSLLVVSLLAACAGPSAHQAPAGESALTSTRPEAVRAPVASTLAPADPLAASNCSLPTAPSTGCAEPAPQKEEEGHPHHHQGHGAETSAPEAPVVAADTRVIDPVCKMQIDPKTAKGGTLTHEGTQHWFCSASCRNAFLEQNPGAQATLPPETKTPPQRVVTAVKKPAAALPATVTDPVCKMKIDPKTAKGGTLTHEGTQHWFCSSSCRNTFLTQNPGAK
jgi:YHS domain-containing protein